MFGLRAGMADVVIPRSDNLTLLSNSFVLLVSIMFPVCDRNA